MKHIEKPGLFAMLCFSAFLLAGTKASAETLSSGEAEWARGVGEITAISQETSLNHEFPPLPATGAPAPVRTDDQDPAIQFDCGIWGILCAEDMPFRAASTSENVRPINTGFKALGGAGTPGKINGPGWKGDGTYRMKRNDSLEVSIIINTGYIDGQMTLARETQTGADTLRFAGKLWDKDKNCWGPYRDDVGNITIIYDAKKDRGEIPWKENGETKKERYWSGKKGRKMTIEFGGGWNHDFIQK